MSGTGPPGPPLLFLSGAGLPGWIWDDVRACLPPSWPTAVAAQPVDATGSLLAHAQQVLDETVWPGFVVVAHSIGGVVATGLAHLDPQRVQGVLGVAAVVPRPDRSFLGSLPFPRNHVLGALVRLVGTRPPEKAIRTGLTSALEDAVADRVVDGFRPAPRWLYRDRAPQHRFPARRGYLFTDQDRELPPRLQRTYAGELAPTWTGHLPTGHLPMLQDPAGTSRAVQEFCQAASGA